MKLKVVIVDLEIPPHVKRWALRIGIPLAVLLGGSAIAYAAGLVTWTDGQTLKAADLNANFSNLQGQITTQSLAPRTPSAFRAQLTMATTVSGEAVTPVALDSVLFDLGGEYNAATGVFTPKSTGVYEVTCSLEFFNGPSGNVYGAQIWDGSSELDGTDVQSSLTGEIRAIATTVAHLSAGDAVSCRSFATPTGSNALFAQDPTRNAFSAARLY
jgi:hypothetical protein